MLAGPTRVHSLILIVFLLAVGVWHGRHVDGRVPVAKDHRRQHTPRGQARASRRRESPHWLRHSGRMFSLKMSPPVPNCPYGAIVPRATHNQQLMERCHARRRLGLRCATGVGSRSLTRPLRHVRLPRQGTRARSLPKPPAAHTGSCSRNVLPVERRTQTQSRSNAGIGTGTGRCSVPRRSAEANTQDTQSWQAAATVWQHNGVHAIWPSAREHEGIDGLLRTSAASSGAHVHESAER